MAVQRLWSDPKWHRLLIYCFWCDLQLNNRTSETELLQAFSQFGRIVSHTIRRATSCAYIDFDESHAATLARRAMNGALLCGSALRVEFKVGQGTLPFLVDSDKMAPYLQAEPSSPALFALINFRLVVQAPSFTATKGCLHLSAPSFAAAQDEQHLLFDCPCCKPIRDQRSFPFGHAQGSVGILF